METALKTGFLLVWFSILNIICPESFGSRGSDGISITNDNTDFRLRYVPASVFPTLTVDSGAVAVLL
jgi:hypothetical protein